MKFFSAWLRCTPALFRSALDLTDSPGDILCAMPSSVVGVTPAAGTTSNGQEQR
jgi:hypothetical protein